MDISSLGNILSRYPILYLCYSPRESSLRIIGKAILFCSLLPGIIVFASFLDGTLYMAKGCRGLLQHYGFWGWVLTTPVIIYLAIASLGRFRAILVDIDIYSTSGSAPPDLERVIRSHIRSLSLKGRSRWMLFLFSLIGLLFTVVNIRSTLEPLATYGNLVFDSPPFWRGFVLTKFYLLGLWTLVYPPILFLAIHLTWSLVSILRHMCKHDILRIDFFHSDNCGGVSGFGTVNAYILAIYSCIFIVVAALHETHRNTYGTLLMAALGASLLCFLQSIGAVYHIHKFISIKKEGELNLINRRLSSETNDLDNNDLHMTFSLLSLRTHLMSIHTYPYGKATLAVVNVLRFAPAVLALARLASLGSGRLV